MSESIGGIAIDTFLPGSRDWLWGRRARVRKTIGPTAGIEGETDLTTALGARAGRFGLRDPATGRVLPALMECSGESAAAAIAALNAIEEAISLVIDAGTALDWEDADGRTGSQLVLGNYEKAGERIVGTRGSTYYAWQRYFLAFKENWGGWYD